MADNLGVAQCVQRPFLMLLRFESFAGKINRVLALLPGDQAACRLVLEGANCRLAINILLMSMPSGTAMISPSRPLSDMVSASFRALR